MGHRRREQQHEAGHLEEGVPLSSTRGAPPRPGKPCRPRVQPRRWGRCRSSETTLWCFRCAANLMRSEIIQKVLLLPVFISRRRGGIWCSSELASARQAGRPSSALPGGAAPGRWSGWGGVPGSRADCFSSRALCAQLSAPEPADLKRFSFP